MQKIPIFYNQRNNLVFYLSIIKLTTLLRTKLLKKQFKLTFYGSITLPHKKKWRDP